MFPTLFSLGPITLHSYGLMVALGLSLAIWLAWRRAPQEGLSRDRLMDMVFWMVAAGLAGARLLYVAVSWREFAGDPLAVFRLWDGGLVFYGGFAGAFLALLYFCRAHRLPLAGVLDLLAPYIPLAHGFGRIGCFLAGCCYGLASDACLAVTFPALADGQPRLPVQLFEAGFNFLLFAGLVGARRWGRLQPGQRFWLYLASYAAGRFVLEFFRGDDIRGAFFFPWLHTSQLIALLVLAAAGAAFAITALHKKKRS